MPMPPTVTPRSAWIPVVAAIIFYGLASFSGLDRSSIASPFGVLLATALLPILVGTVFAAVHHAEVIALRTGEPYGTLVLTIAVTVIEVALIISITAGAESRPALTRDTVFSVVMIVGNGLVGLCILLGGIRHREQGFRTTGANAYLVVLMVLATFTLVLPNYTRALPGPVYSTGQLVFVTLVTVALYGGFLYIQTVRNRDYFLVLVTEGADARPYLPRDRAVVASAILLFLSLSAVVLLSKMFTTVVEFVTTLVNAPEAVAGVIVALLILAPESVAAVRAARRNQLQKSLNLALGSSLATISLTVPAVAALHLWLHKDLVLGLDGEDTVLLMLTAVVSVLTFGTGRTNILYGFVHLVIFSMFLFLVFAP